MSTGAGAGMNRRAQAQAILAGLDRDAALVPAHLVEWWRRYLQVQTPRYLDVIALLDAAGTPTGARVLEVGSVPGQLTAVLGGLGFVVTGVDLAPQRLAAFWERHGLTVERADIEREALPFADDQFDLILFNEVLEHLRVNPLFALGEIARVLRPQGRLLLSTPQITLLHRLRFLAGGDVFGDPVVEFGKLAQLGHMGHIRLYERREIVAFCEAAGLRVTAAFTAGELVTRSWKTAGLRLLNPSGDRLRQFVYVWAGKRNTETTAEEHGAHGGGTEDTERFGPIPKP